MKRFMIIFDNLPINRNNEDKIGKTINTLVEKNSYSDTSCIRPE